MGCKPTQEIRRFTLASRAMRLLRVLSMLPSTSFGSSFWVLAGFEVRSLKKQKKRGPNRNGLGSPKLRLRAILSPDSAMPFIYEVRSVPANPFDNTEKYVPVTAVSLVRNGDNGGGNGTPIEPSPSQSIDFKLIIFARCTLHELSTLQTSYMAMPSNESGILLTSSKLVSTLTARPCKHQRYHPARI